MRSGRNFMIILVASCDKNTDIFEAFHHCIEKYWSDHPEIIYKTETVQNPYYKTLCADYPLDKWTRGMREVLEKIDDDKILLMIDDIFIHAPVDTERLNYAVEHLTGNIANMNFELSFDPYDEPTEIEGFSKRREGSPYQVSIMCGLWQKDKLIKVLSVDQDPWSVEKDQKTYGYDYLINDGDFIIDWGYHNTFYPVGLVRGEWTREAIHFLKSEGLEVNTKRKVRI